MNAPALYRFSVSGMWKLFSFSRDGPSAIVVIVDKGKGNP